MPQDLDDQVRAIVYVDDYPDIPQLAKEWTDTLAGLDYYLEQTRRAYDTRRNYWAGQTPDRRKHGPNAFPWEGASDMDTQIVEERMLKMLSLLVRALERSHIQAYPVGEDDIVRSRIVSRFLKWMRENWIEDFRESAERNGNYWLEKGLMVTMAGWETKKVSAMEKIDINDLPEEVQFELADEEYQQRVAEKLAEKHKVPVERALKAVRELERDGFTKLPVEREEVSRPTVRACSPDSDVYFPPWVMDPQRSPYYFYRELATVQEVLGRVESEEWDKGWADYVITHCRGKSSNTNPGMNNRNNIPNNPLSRFQAVDTGLIELIWMYQRLIDEETGAEGIYCTVFCPGYTDETGEAQNYAIRYLIDGASNYNLITTRLFNDEARLYDVRTFPDLMRSAQNAVKAERDARNDANSLRNCPPLEYERRPPKGVWAPGGMVGGSKARFADTPKPNPQSLADEEIMLTQISRLLGLDEDDPTGRAIQDYFVSRFLNHFAKVLSLAFEQYQRYGPDEVMFRVTGFPEMTRMDRRAGEKLDITITFDTLFTDPDSVLKMVEAAGNMLQFDDSNQIDKDEFKRVGLSAISPIFAQQLLRPSDESKREFTEKVVNDLTRIRAGFEVDAQQNGAQMALPIVQQWASRPDVMAELQENEFFQKALEKYVMQYVFQQQQQENAVTGRLGTAPAIYDVNQPSPPMNGARK